MAKKRRNYLKGILETVIYRHEGLVIAISVFVFIYLMEYYIPILFKFVSARIHTPDGNSPVLSEDEAEFKSRLPRSALLAYS